MCIRDRVHAMQLTIHNFPVQKICFGEKNTYQDGCLTLDKEALLTVVKSDPHITWADLRLANPGDALRLCPVKRCV